MAEAPTRTYSPNYMKAEKPLHPWTIWFRAKQAELGMTLEDFARAADMGVRTAATYRSGTIPRRKEQIAKIARAFDGDVGPLPDSSRALDLEERVRRLELASIAARGGTADAFRVIIERLNQPGLSGQHRALAQEELNALIAAMEPTPEELRRLIDDAHGRADEASDE